MLVSFTDQVSDEKARLRNQLAQDVYESLSMSERIAELELTMKRKGIGKFNDSYACMVFAMWVIAWDDYDRNGPDGRGSARNYCDGRNWSG